MDINLNYVHDQSIGYGRLGVKLADALVRAGVAVYDHMPSPLGVDAGVEVEGRSSGLSGNVCWVSVPSHARGWWSTQEASIFTMWETQHLPESFRESLHNFQTVLVPSKQNVELFSQYHENVKPVYLGVDPKEWHYVERTPPGAFFDFLICGSGSRKGTDLAFKAFLAAFPDDALPAGPIPRLLMKPNPRRNGPGTGNDGEVMSHERVLQITPWLSPEEEQALYAMAHCYVQPSRGEGFGMQPLQAMAQGLPTILTDAHGHASFSHLGYGIPAGESQADYFIFGEAKSWWEPDFDALVDLYRWVYDNWGAAVEKARQSAVTVAAEFTWDNTAAGFIDALDLTRPYTEGDWVEPKAKLYRVRVRKRHICDIAERRYMFEPGVDYWHPADVKRVLAESGYLDPECTGDEDSGLTPEQVAKLRPAEEHQYCPTCEQRYGTGLTRADDILIAQGDADLVYVNVDAERRKQLLGIVEVMES